jgi:hypothetical protein
MMFVEVLDRHGEVRSRQRLAGDAFTIGRAYDNDLILDDPYVAPHHLRVERDADGHAVATDLGSRNGLYLLNPSRRVQRAQLGQDTRVRIGRTQLRFRDAAFPVAPELEAQASRPRLHGVRFYLAFALTAALFAADGYSTVFEPAVTGQVLAAVLAALLGVFAWAGMWSLVGRLATRRAQFYRHGTYALLAAAGLLAAQELTGYVEFGLSPAAAGPLGMLAGVAIIAALLFGHIRLVSRTAPRRAALTASAIALVFTGSFTLVEYSVSLGYTPGLDYARSLKAPAFQIAPSRSTAAFLEEAETLRVTIDALRDADRDTFTPGD